MRRFARLCFTAVTLGIGWLLGVVYGPAKDRTTLLLVRHSACCWSRSGAHDSSRTGAHHSSMQVPLLLVAAFGVYAVAAVGIGVARFPSRPEEAAALRRVSAVHVLRAQPRGSQSPHCAWSQDIAEAKRDLIAKGVLTE